jgi:hypothetical protein
MTDLYDKLGVPREATPEEIKTAYRHWARITHPDAGGKAEDFKDIADAYAVLSNADRRARYDESGDTATVTEEMRHTEALNVIQAMMEQVLSQVGNGPVCNDVVAKMRDAMQEAVTKIEADIDGMRQHIVRLAKFANRFHLKGDAVDNVLRTMVDFKISGLERRISDITKARDRHQAAAEILEDYSFEADPEPAASPYGARPPNSLLEFGAGLARNSGWGRSNV